MSIATRERESTRKILAFFCIFSRIRPEFPPAIFQGMQGRDSSRTCSRESSNYPVFFPYFFPPLSSVVTLADLPNNPTRVLPKSPQIYEKKSLKDFYRKLQESLQAFLRRFFKYSSSNFYMHFFKNSLAIPPVNIPENLLITLIGTP